jgi:hypothetical protein
MAGFFRGRPGPFAPKLTANWQGTNSLATYGACAAGLDGGTLRGNGDGGVTVRQQSCGAVVSSTTLGKLESPNG